MNETDKPHASLDVKPAGEMQKKYGLWAENRSPIRRLDPAQVPENLRHLIPDAEYWGEGDDIVRDDMVKKASPDQIKRLYEVFQTHQGKIYEWLGGPAAKVVPMSDEYIAFSCLGEAGDYATFLVEHGKSDT